MEALTASKASRRDLIVTPETHRFYSTARPTKRDAQKSGRELQHEFCLGSVKGAKRDWKTGGQTPRYNVNVPTLPLECFLPPLTL